MLFAPQINVHKLHVNENWLHSPSSGGGDFCGAKDASSSLIKIMLLWAWRPLLIEHLLQTGSMAYIKYVWHADAICCIMGNAGRDVLRIWPIFWTKRQDEKAILFTILLKSVSYSHNNFMDVQYNTVSCIWILYITNRRQISTDRTLEITRWLQ